MGLMDTVKHGAEQAIAKAQEGVAQGQAKLDQVQAKRQHDALFRQLGMAYYAQVRHDGPPAAVQAALSALDTAEAEAEAASQQATGEHGAAGGNGFSGTVN